MDRILYKFYKTFIQLLSGFIWNKNSRKNFRDKALNFYDSKTQCKKNKANNNYTIISLGKHCLPRTVLTEQGLKPTKLQGEPSYPFDLAVHPISSVIHFLETDFSDYFDDLFFNKELKIWENRKYYAHYNHDADCDENDEEKLIVRFKNRIENFRKTILNKNTFIFFVIASVEKEDSLNKLYSILKKLRNNINFKLLVIDMSCKLDKAHVFRNIGMFQIHHPFLHEDNWWIKGYRDSEAGKEYFRLVSEFIKKEIEKEFKVINYKEAKCYQ